MNEHGKSDGPVVPKKRSNERGGRLLREETVEERGPAKGNPYPLPRHRTQSRTEPMQALVRIREAVFADRGNVFIRCLNPSDRFARHHPRQEPGAVVPHAGICAGGPG